MAKLSSTNIYGDLYVDGTISGVLSGSVSNKLIVKLNGGTTEGTNQFTFNGSAAKTINITPSSIGAAASSHGTHLTLGTGSGNAFRGDYGNTAYTHSQAAHAPSNAQKNSDITKAEIEAKLTGAITSHTHTYAGSSSAGGAATSANKVNTNLIVKLNSGTTEGTNLFTFNGSTAKTINITPSSIGAAASSHGTHLTLGTGSGNAFRGDYGNTAYTHSQAAHAPSNAQKNSDITKAEIEAKLTGAITSHTHDYAPSSHNHTSLTGITSLAFNTEGTDSGSISTTIDSSNTYFDFNLSDDPSQNDMWRWRFLPSGGTVFDAMTLDPTSTTAAKLTVTGNVTATSFTENGTALSSKYAASGHTHNYAGSSSAGGAATSANKVNTNLVVKLNGGSTEGTNLFTFNGSTAKTVNITPSSIGALASNGTAANSSKVNGYDFWVGTQEQYDAISSKSSTTVYLIKE